MLLLVSTGREKIFLIEHGLVGSMHEANPAGWHAEHALKYDIFFS